MSQQRTDLIFAIQNEGAAKALREMRLLEDRIDSSYESLGKMAKSSDLSNRALAKQAKTLAALQTDVTAGMQSYTKEYQGYLNEVRSGKLEKAYKASYRSVQASLQQLQRAQESGIESEIKLREVAYKRSLQIYKKQSVALTQRHEKEKAQVEEIMEIRKKGLKGLAASGAQGTVQALQSLRSRDAAGAFTTVGRGVGQAGKYVQGAAGDRLVQARAAGAGGGQMAMLKTMATLGKAASALSTVAGPLAVVVKIMQAAYDQTLSLNKGLLTTRSLAAMLPDPFMETKDAIARGRAELDLMRADAVGTTGGGLGAQVDEIRERFLLGLSKEDLAQMASAYDNVGASRRNVLKTGAREIDYLKQAAIASTNLGVEQQEVFQLQGTLIDEQGTQFEKMAEGLSQITRQADLSGMSTKRFFGILGQTAGGLGMYNFRLEETGALLAQLSKTMSAQDAGALLSGVGRSISNASPAERLKYAEVLGKGQVRRTLQGNAQDIFSGMTDDQIAQINKQLGKQGLGSIDRGSAAKTLAGLGAKDKNELLSGLDKGTMDQVAKGLRIMDKTKGGTLSLADAMGDLDAAQNIQMQIDYLEKVFKGRDLSQISEIEATNVGGVSSDDYRRMARFQQVSKGQFTALQRGAAGGAEAFKAEAQRMGFEGLSTRDGKIYNASGQEVQSYKDLAGVLTDKQKSDLKEQMMSQKEMAQAQIKATRSVTDALEQGVSAILNNIYSLMQDIYAVILRIPGVSNAEERQQLARDQATRKKTFAEANYQAALKSGDRSKISKAGEALKAAKQDLSAVSPFSGFTSESNMDAVMKQAQLEAAGSSSGITQGMGKHLPQIAKGMRQSLLDSKSTPAELKEQLEKGTLTAESSEELSKQTLQVLKDKGIEISPETLTKLSREMAREMVLEQVKADAMRDLKLGAGQAGIFARQAISGQSISSAGYTPAQLKQYQDYFSNKGFKPTTPTPAGDAYMVTGGVPFLNLKQGDMVVDKESLAQTISTPQAGGFLPKGAGQAVAPTQHNYYITVDDTQLKEKILSVMQEVQRANLVK